MGRKNVILLIILIVVLSVFIGFLFQNNKKQIEQKKLLELKEEYEKEKKYYEEIYLKDKNIIIIDKKDYPEEVITFIENNKNTDGVPFLLDGERYYLLDGHLEIGYYKLNFIDSGQLEDGTFVIDIMAEESNSTDSFLLIKFETENNYKIRIIKDKQVISSRSIIFNTENNEEYSPKNEIEIIELSSSLEFNDFIEMNKRGRSIKEIKYNNKNYIIVFAGTYDTNGYSLEFMKSEEKDGILEYKVYLKEPIDGLEYKQEKTYPYLIIEKENPSEYVVNIYTKRQ